MTHPQKAASLTLCLLALLVVSVAAQAAYVRRWTIFPERSGVRVLVSVPQLADIAKRIGEKRVSVVSLLKPKMDLRNPKISKSMLKAVEEADVLLRLNPDLDPWIENLAKRSGNQRLCTETGIGYSCVESAASRQTLDPDALLKGRERSIAQVMLAAFVRADPKNETYYRSNSDAYLRTLTNSTQAKQKGKK